VKGKDGGFLYFLDVHTYTHESIHTYVRDTLESIHTYVREHTYVYAYMCIYMHTYKVYT